MAKLNFDPSDAGNFKDGIFGLPFSEDEAELILIPVPWEVTTSYGVGASMGPQLILQASEQVDLFDLETGRPFERGIHMTPISKEILSSSRRHKKIVQRIVGNGPGKPPKGKELQKQIDTVNQACRKMIEEVKSQSLKLLKKGKIVGLIGGDHSTPQGLIEALCEVHDSDFGILHIDAHADLREAYQGFTYSHASIMYNVMKLKNAPRKLVQVGIRDFCEPEYDFIQNSKGKITTFFDRNLKNQLHEGKNWNALCGEIVKALPKKVYVSFDIDGLDPALCPKTGTPVIGGLSNDQVQSLFKALFDHGHQIIGFDLNEVSSGGQPLSEAEWDGNVGARMVYKLAGWTFKTN